MEHLSDEERHKIGTSFESLQPDSMEALLKDKDDVIRKVAEDIDHWWGFVDSDVLPPEQIEESVDAVLRKKREEEVSKVRESTNTGEVKYKLIFQKYLVDFDTKYESCEPDPETIAEARGNESEVKFVYDKRKLSLQMLDLLSGLQQVKHLGNDIYQLTVTGKLKGGLSKSQKKFDQGKEYTISSSSDTRYSIYMRRIS